MTWRLTKIRLNLFGYLQETRQTNGLFIIEDLNDKGSTFTKNASMTNSIAWWSVQRTNQIGLTMFIVENTSNRIRQRILTTRKNWKRDPKVRRRAREGRVTDESRCDVSEIGWRMLLSCLFPSRQEILQARHSCWMSARFRRRRRVLHAIYRLSTSWVNVLHRMDVCRTDKNSQTQVPLSRFISSPVEEEETRVVNVRE